MGQTLGSLAEFILAYRTPDGRGLARLGVVQTTVDMFPPGAAVTYDSYPPYNAYASITYWNRGSPQMVPGAFELESYQAGVQQITGNIEQVNLSEGQNVWIEITNDKPARTTITNLSGLNQFFQQWAFYLVVDSPEDLKDIHNLIRKWSNTDEVSKQLIIMNDNLKNLNDFLVASVRR